MKNRLFVGGLPRDIDRQTVKDFFSQWGTVGDVYVPVDPATGNGRGFCFVTFETDDQAAAALAANGQQIPGWDHHKNLAVDYALPRRDRR